MSFSLAHVALIRTATQLAAGVATRVGEAVGFDEILHRSTGEAASGDSQPNDLPNGQLTTGQLTTGQLGAGSLGTGSLGIGELTRELIDRIRTELSRHSITLNQPLRVHVRDDQTLSVESDHPGVSQIEAVLNSVPQVVALVEQLAGKTGSPEILIDLTNKGDRENMVGPGGYPNW